MNEFISLAEATLIDHPDDMVRRILGQRIPVREPQYKPPSTPCAFHRVCFPFEEIDGHVEVWIPQETTSFDRVCVKVFPHSDPVFGIWSSSLAAEEFRDALQLDGEPGAALETDPAPGRPGCDQPFQHWTVFPPNDGVLRTPIEKVVSILEQVESRSDRIRDLVSSGEATGGLTIQWPFDHEFGTRFDEYEIHVYPEVLKRLTDLGITLNVLTTPHRIPDSQ